MGTQPRAGTYHSQDIFIRSTFQRINKVLEESVQFRVTSIMTNGDNGFAELEMLHVTHNSVPF